MSTAGVKPPIKDRLEACIASGAVTKKYVAISDGLDSNGNQKAKISNSAGAVIPIGIIDHDASDTHVADIQTKGRATGISSAALATLYTQLSFTNAGKLKAAAAGEHIIGYNVSTCTAADEDVSIELSYAGIKA